jgi:protein involved in polysaccharide export with SLBB domain
MSTPSRSQWKFKLERLGVMAVVILGSALTSFGQQVPPPEIRLSEVRDANRATPKLYLAADQVIAILKREPGLLLQVKKVLIQKAEEEGRFLSEEELTDETVYRLVAEDWLIRAIATQEITDRGYITIKPTKEEAERSRLEAQRQEQLAERNAGSQGRESTGDANRESANDWSSRKGTPADQQSQPVGGSSRQTQTRGSETLPDSDYPDARHIRPDELPQVLRAGGASAVYADGRPDSAIGTGMYSGMASGLSAEQMIGSGPSDIASQMESFNDRDLSGNYDLSQRNQTAPKSSGVVTRPRPMQPTIKHRPNPYADVPSLYDLYAQVSRRSPTLERFGMEVFRNGTGNLEDLPMDVPVGPEYVLGPGDGLKIDLWGGVSQRLQRTVDREGRVSLPEVGTVLVAGRSLGDVQHEVQAVLRTQFRDVQADLALARLRNVRVYVVGDVARPGAYDISALSTPLNAVYAAGGPTDAGSLRTVRHFRGKVLVEEVDLYDLLLHGTRPDVKLLQPGDTILVPPAGSQVTVEGMVRRPAIYEIRDEQDLADVLALAGGVLPSGALRHIDVERVEAHEKRTMVRLDLPPNNDQPAVDRALEQFKVKDGDDVKISPILPYSDKTVYLDGHVFRPGKYPYREGMKVTDIIKSYSELLPEPANQHAEIIRLNAPDYTPVVLAFNLGNALSGSDQDLELKPFDTLRIFGRYDFEDPPVIAVSGEVRDPGEHRTNGATRLRDAIYLAGGLTPDAMLEDAQIFRKTDDSQLKVISVNLEKALAGDPADNITLQPKDRVLVHRNLAKVDPPSVFIRGEVAKPGKYPLAEGVTASELVRLAGGFRRSAFAETADLSRYLTQQGNRVLGNHQEVQIAKALAGDTAADVTLKDGDVLTIRQLAGWNDIGAAITVKGEVLHPGTYGIREGERLSSILQRVGGLRAEAYPAGAVLERVQVRELAEKSRQELIHRIEGGGNLNLGATSTGQEQAALLQAASQQQQQVLQSLKNQPATGRMVIRLSPDFKRWENTTADIEVRAGDVLTIPKKPGFVLVSGQVYNASAITFQPGKNAGWYLRQAGGPTDLANKKDIFIVRADGSVFGHSSAGSGWWSGNILSVRMQPGDTVVVPEKILIGSTFWRNTLTAAQFMSSMAITARVATSF